MEVTGYTRLAGLIAKPARHSISPLMHNTAFKANNIDAVYLSFEVEKEQLPQFIKGISAFGMIGVNVSMPYKLAVIPYLDELSEAATLIGAVNTIVPQKDGRLVGHNTDGSGFMRSLVDSNVEIIGEEITVIGTGGAATAICVQAALDGVQKINVFNRQGEFFTQKQQKINEIAQKSQCTLSLTDLADGKALNKALGNSKLLVNATDVGMKPNEAQTPIQDFSAFHDDLAVYDVIYNPRETKLIQIAKEKGLKTVNGLGMLLYQGTYAFELWTGKKMPLEIVKPLVANS
ncbi:shikimate dehydrogenase [Enterococcus dispar]|uniref:Shikimate dehydrogenase (NADP(+)) n=1 Tax=Enterococcus dispar ATCC 51266 TaxID=1139219 RepID=S0KW96_9ENTE|nr:shikimate dehydrogenase [Enterococcus dispar]EOT43461.1 shikimate 5-dehydrogenase [Enterococcus dispar ATCC 51266]EOW85091.1 shikimate 5-dehydrogenase [Enterococcus dispar ATCC 51266]OJG39983.1 shikimate 5-dehydrogenase [Enterococcus dispar]